MNAHPLKPIHDWVKGYERSWSQRFSRLDAVLENLKTAEHETRENGDGDSDEER